MSCNRPTSKFLSTKVTRCINLCGPDDSAAAENPRYYNMYSGTSKAENDRFRVKQVLPGFLSRPWGESAIMLILAVQCHSTHRISSEL